LIRQLHSDHSEISNLISASEITRSQIPRPTYSLQSRHVQACKMDTNTQSTLVLLLYAFVTINAIRYWRRVPYGSEVGSFTWITHRGPLLSYAPSFMALTAQPSCRIPAEHPPLLRHALCHIPYIRGEWIFAFFAVASVRVWASALSEVWLHWRRKPRAEPPFDEEAKQEDHTSSVEKDGL
jgi:hypothetical protein